jgi:hypothetical protein
LESVMIELSAENVFPIAEAPKHIPGRPSIATVWRWVLRGCAGTKLESILIGGRRFTSEEAIQRFADATTAAADGDPAPARTSRQRQRAIDRAERELSEAGI